MTAPTGQLTLFAAPLRDDPEPGPVRHDAPDTSHEAAEAIAPCRGKLCRRLLAYVQSRGLEGTTNEEAAIALRLRTSSQTARMHELMSASLVVDSSARRKTTAGRSAIVWVSMDAQLENGKEAPNGR